MFTNIRYILLTALRDWLFAALMIGVIACTLVAHMLGSTALIETQEMTLSYSTASARIVIVAGLIVFACFHVRSAFDTREIDVFLSRPITRSSLVFSYWLGFAAFTLKSAVTSVIASMGFYVLARMMGFFIATTNSAFLFDTHWVNTCFTGLLKIVSIFMPRLDFFAKSGWLIYGVKNTQDIHLFLLQALIFIPLLILATIADFRRKQF